MLTKKCFATFPFSILFFPHYRSVPNPYPFSLLVSIGAHPGLQWMQFGLIPQLAAKTCSLQLLSPQLIALPSCCALPEGCSANSQLWAYLLSQAKPAPKWPLVLVHWPPSFTPQQKPSVFLWQSKTPQHGAGAGLIRL